jgi:hypothetical protein
LGRADLCFVPQSELPKGQAYEAFIHAHQRIPTRDNLHDFFNGLCWLRFGRSKRRLNQLQAQDIARQGVTQQRGALRDALTVFDENAILLQAPDGLWQALSARDWPSLFVHQRHQWAQARVEVFGHALLEKLVQPYVAITGHAWRVGYANPWKYCCDVFDHLGIAAVIEGKIFCVHAGLSPDIKTLD